MASSSTTVFFAVLTTNAPLRGLPRFTETFTEPLACLETYALMASARFLNACQDLHASMYTAPLGIELISSSHGEPEPPEAAGFFAAAGFFVTAFVTGVFLAALPLEALAFPLVAGIASGARGVCGRVCAGRRRTRCYVPTHQTLESFFSNFSTRANRRRRGFRSRCDSAFICSVAHTARRTARALAHREPVTRDMRACVGATVPARAPVRRSTHRRTRRGGSAVVKAASPETDGFARDGAPRTSVRRSEPSPGDAGVRLSRRLSLFGGLAGVASAASLAEALPATAGEVLDQLQALLSDAEAAIEADPENDALLGQRTFFENQLERTQLNASFVDRLRPRVRSGDLPYLQRVAFAVRDDLWEDEIYFWKNAMGCRVTRELYGGADGKTVAGVVLAFGQESLSADDGGKGGVELRKASSAIASSETSSAVSSSSANHAAAANTSGAPSGVGSLAYVSLSVPYGVRVSRIYEAGGELVYGFGYFDVRSPSGYAVRARVAARRDPMELVALNVPDVAASVAFFETAFGMRASTPLDQNGYAPKSPPGSRLMTFGEVKETLGILLQPSQALEDPEAARKQGEAFAGVRFVVGGGEPPSPTPRRAPRRLGTIPNRARCPWRGTRRGRRTWRGARGRCRSSTTSPRRWLKTETIRSGAFGSGL